MLTLHAPGTAEEGAGAGKEDDEAAQRDDDAITAAMEKAKTDEHWDEAAQFMAEADALAAMVPDAAAAKIAQWRPGQWSVAWATTPMARAGPR